MSYDPAYIVIAEDGHVTLFWGDGTEAVREAIVRGPAARDERELFDVIQEMKAWAEARGYTVIVPAYDLEVPRDLAIDVPDEEADRLTMDDVDDLLDDLTAAE